MAISFIDKSYLDSDIDKIVQNTNITNFSAASKAKLIFDIVNDKFLAQVNTFENNINIPFLRNAPGAFLDYIGEIFGVERPKATRVTTQSEDKIFYFHTLETNFGVINNGRDIVIPAGTKIMNTTSDTSNRIIYLTTETTILPRNQNKVYFAAQSDSYGENANAGENTLIYHDFTNYSDYLNDSLMCANETSITYGSDEMTDDNYRFFISKQQQIQEAANFTALEAKLRLIPGISDVKRILYRRGIGTADWIIKSITPTVSGQLLDLAQSVLDSYESDGLDHLAITPVNIGVQLFISITYTKRLESKEKEQIKTDVIRNLTNQINSLDIGQSLIVDQLIKTILNSSDKIQSIGTPIKPIDRIILYKRSDISDSRLKRTLLSDYTANEYDRVIVEPTIDNPISIVDKN